jgi:hypothetical protein
MLDVVAVVLQLALGIAVPAWLLRFDEHRLSPAMLERAWPRASFWSAVVAFGPLCLPVHFVRTRRSVVGLLLGLLALIVALGVQILVGLALSFLGGE